MKSLICFLLVITFLLLGLEGCNKNTNDLSLEKKLTEFVKDKDARIGVAVISQDGHTISINGNESFPMLSVYKFPQALAVADFCIKHHISFSDTILIDKSQIHPDTYSPLRENYGIADLRLPISELLKYSIQQSDNNACDILFNLIGGAEVSNIYISELGFPEIHLKSTEDEMHKDHNLCYQNSSTPLEMCRLLSYFNKELKHSHPEFKYISNLLETCQTGLERLPKGLNNGDLLGHKTGTGDINSDGKIIAINDVGYIQLSNGQKYCIAVFISDSGYDMETTSHFIGEISNIVANFYR
ncbi:MAG: class A beta-lactamase [Paramuribaculum sp.]|nr:class A beta-lactamase [Paramuribaculum sp.]